MAPSRVGLLGILIFHSLCVPLLLFGLNVVYLYGDQATDYAKHIITVFVTSSIILVFLVAVQLFVISDFFRHPSKDSLEEVDERFQHDHPAYVELEYDSRPDSDGDTDEECQRDCCELDGLTSDDSADEEDDDLTDIEDIETASETDDDGYGLEQRAEEFITKVSQGCKEEELNGLLF